jgi:hypothetical protein
LKEIKNKLSVYLLKSFPFQKKLIEDYQVRQIERQKDRKTERQKDRKTQKRDNYVDNQLLTTPGEIKFIT